MSYQTLLLDADGTLLDFLKAEACALEKTFRQHQLYFDETILKDYSMINDKCWKEFEQGLLSKETLLVERFQRLFDKYNFSADANAVRRTYQYELSLGAYLIENAYETCEELAKHCDLYIVTNGVTSTQRRRLADCGLDKLIRDVFISEEIGAQKPKKEFFDYVFAHIPGFKRENTLMVGDSLSADIKGGISANLDTCWYNPNGIAKPEDMEITYIIHDIRDLIKLAV